MDLQSRLAISYYKTIAVLNESHKVYLVQHLETKKVYVKKILDVYTLKVFEYLKAHPINGLPRISELYEEDGQLTLIEEYITGDTLQTRMEAKRLTLTSITYYTYELCKILDRLHTSDPPVIHRDIKPSNIIIADPDRVVLLDFNAANTFHSEKDRDTILLGTQGYAAPEQYGFAASSPQTDIYSLGIVLKEMLQTLDPAPSASVSESLQLQKLKAVINRCTQFDPNNRYGSALEILGDISYSKADPSGSSPSETDPSGSGPTETDPSAAEQVDQVRPDEDYNPYLPPGFRSNRLWKKLIASGYYLTMVLTAVSMRSDDPLFNSQWGERLSFLATAITLFFLANNYMKVLDHLPLCNFKNPILRSTGRLFMTCLGSLLVIFIEVVISSIFFGT